jgi:hypothetical protein
MKYTIYMDSDDMIYVPGFVNLSSGFEVILSLMLRQSDRLQYW